jgi:hypothetical protein
LISFCGFPVRQRRRQVVPEAEEARVQHHQDPADVARALLVEVQQPGLGVVVLARRPVAVAPEEPHGHERVEEVEGPARVQLELAPELLRRQLARPEAREEPELDRREQHLRGPEGERGLEDGRDVEGRRHAEMLPRPPAGRKPVRTRAARR